MKLNLFTMAAVGMTLLWLGGAARGGQPSGPTTTGPASKPKRSILQLIQSIKGAADAASAGKDYAEARKIDPDSAELGSAYMQTMWKFGKYRTAYYPALQLTKKDPANGLAWAIVGYYHAMRGSYSKALEPTLRAARCLPDDAAIMTNIGYLVAWYEKTRPQPKLSEEMKELIDIGKMVWAGTKQFAEAHASYGKATGGDEGAAKAGDRRISGNKKIESLTTEYNKLDKEFKQKHKQAFNHANNRKNWLNQLAEVEKKRKRRKKDKNLLNQRDSLKRQIVQAARKIAELNKAMSVLRVKARKIKKDLEAARGEDAKAKTGERTRPKVQWRRPGAEGKTTPDLGPVGKDKGKKGEK